jgi:SAM-dependent methyltransferase
MGIIEEVDALGLKVTALKTALELDLFTIIAAGNRTAAEISRAADCNQRAMGILLEALCPLGLLIKEGDCFSLTPVAQAYLVKDSPGYCVPIYLTWLRQRERFTEFVRTGRPGIDLTSSSPEVEECWVSYAAQERVRWPLALERIQGYWQQLNLPLGRGLKVLDVGSGAGHKVFALARLDPTLQVTCLDSPRVLEVTKEVARAMGVTDQIQFLAGDLSNNLPDDGSFDLVVVGSLLHYFSSQTNVQILAKVRRTLKPVGRILLISAMLDEERTDENRLLAALDISNCSREGQVYTFAEYRSMLWHAGYGEVTQANQFMILATRF